MKIRKSSNRSVRAARSGSAGREVLSNGWVIQKIGNRWYLLSRDEFSKYEDHLSDFPKDLMVDSFPTKVSLIQHFLREPAYKGMFEEFGYSLDENWNVVRSSLNSSVRAIRTSRVMAARGYNDDTVYVIFRKVRVDGQWIPCAFWYSSGQSLNFGRIYVIEPETYGGYICEEADMSYYNASKKLTPADDGYDDLKEYTYDWLSDHGDGHGGFKNIVERQRVDYNGLHNSWYRDTIRNDSSVGASRKITKRPIKAGRQVITNYLNFSELDEEQKQQAVEKFLESGDAYDRYSEDMMYWYDENLKELADEYSNKYGLTIHEDKLYWESNSQGPYPKWDLSYVFGDIDEGSYLVKFYGKGTDVEVDGSIYAQGEDGEWYYEDEFDENNAPDAVKPKIEAAQRFIDEVWSRIEDVCRDYPDEDWCYETLEANDYEFQVDDDGNVVKMS